jgi:hypothetical protein
LFAIVHRRAKVQGLAGEVCINKGHLTDENVIPKGAIPTLPLSACQQLAAGGRAGWRTCDGFESTDWGAGRFTKYQLTDDEADFESTPDDCRVSGYNVHALADSFLDAPVPASETVRADSLPRVSAAPKPLEPLRSSVPMPTRPTPQAQPPIDWAFWRAMRTVKLWQACALVVGLDPDRLEHDPDGWMAGPGSGPMFDHRSFSSPQAKDRLDKAMRLAETACSYLQGPIFPKGTPSPGSRRDMDVALAEVVAFFRSCEWTDIPDAIKSMALPPVTSEKELPIAAVAPTTAAPIQKQKAQENRIIELLHAQGYSPNSLTQRAPGKPGPKAEIRTLALSEPSMFTAKTFDTAWQRLRDAAEIAGAE